MEVVPPRSAEMDAILAEMFGVNERAGALVSIAFLEDLLARAIAMKFRPLTDIATKFVFDNAGAPLNTLHAKIHIGYALALYSSAVREDLLTLKDIRNLFAHKSDVRSFQNALVHEHCVRLNYPAAAAKLSGKTELTDALERFQMTATNLVRELGRMIISRSRAHALAAALGGASPAISYPRRPAVPKPKPSPGKGAAVSPSKGGTH